MLSFRQYVSYAASLSVAALLAACGGAESDSANASAASATSALRSASAKAVVATPTATSAASANWVWCASEGGTCQFTGTRQVRFGSGTQLATRTASGSVLCDNSVFGDPAFGKSKSCWYADTASNNTTPIVTDRAVNVPASAATNWTYCSWEGGTCSFSGSRQVRYGTTTANVTRTVTGPVVCDNTAFGDPAPGRAKSCWTAPSSNTPGNNTNSGGSDGSTGGGSGNTGGGSVDNGGSSGSTWQQCAWQGGRCSFSGTRSMRYGVDGAWASKTVTGGASCDDATFGDPAYGRVKTCWVSSTATGGNDTTNGGGGVQNPVIPQPPVIAPSYNRTQLFALANPSITAEAGQDITLRVRVYGVRLPDQSKVFTHLHRDGDDYTIYANVLHHYEWVPSQSWSGYSEYDYVVNVPAGTPPGSYRIASGLHQGVTPYVGRMDNVECNGVPRIGYSNATAVQKCVVGRITVLPQSRGASNATDGPMSMFFVSGRGWTPGS